MDHNWCHPVNNIFFIYKKQQQQQQQRRYPYTLDETFCWFRFFGVEVQMEIHEKSGVGKSE